MALNYRTMEKTGDRLSLLGYGCMRFPRKNGLIDEERARQQIHSALKAGVNYFDTAYLYPGSEKVLGAGLAGWRREEVFIATKLPHIMVKSPKDIRVLFEKQLQRLQTTYIDYYMIHNVGNYEDWQRLKDFGIEEFISQEKKKGRIRHFGFSFHGNLLTFRKLVDNYPWDFCQIQYNYLDEAFQAGTKGLEYAAEKGLGIIIMEPLRGGTLGVKMPEQAQQLLEAQNPALGPASWALRWVFSHPQVHVVLSGMNEEAHIEENIQSASDSAGYRLTQEQRQAIDDVKDFFHNKIKVPCTACAYCMPCPFGVDIPACFSHYNDHSVHGGFMPVYMYQQATAGVVNNTPAGALLCKNCGKCLRHCPQQINIPARLQDAAKTLEAPWLRLPIRAVLKVMSR